MRMLALAALLAPPRASAAGLEALAAQGLPELWRAAAAHVVPAPAPAAAAAERSLERLGYAFEADARAASAQARRNLRAAGVWAMTITHSQASEPPRAWGFRVDFVDPVPGRRVGLRVGGHAASSEEARRALAAVLSELRQAGAPVVLAELLREPGDGRYHYAVSFLAQ